MSSRGNDVRYNASGYYDPTAYAAIMTLEEEEAAKNKLMKTVKYICRLAGFEIENRIVLHNVRSDRYWR